MAEMDCLGAVAEGAVKAARRRLAVGLAPAVMAENLDDRSFGYLLNDKPLLFGTELTTDRSPPDTSCGSGVS